MSKNKKPIVYHQIAEEVVKHLNQHNLGAYIYHKARSGSAYIKFEDTKLCSIRIGDHDGREKYRYKFNLRKDCMSAGWKLEDNIWRYYAPFDNIPSLVAEILKRREFSKNWKEYAR